MLENKRTRRPAGRSLRRFFPVLLVGALVFSGCAGKPAVQKQEKLSPGYDNRLSPEAEELVRKGINSHDQGDYMTAIDYYKKALDIAPDHPVIHYEMGFSYMSLGNSGAALEEADKGLAAAKVRNYNEVIPSLLDLKGSALDNLGRNEEAIDVYLEAIDKYGAANTLLYYNLGLTYYRSGRPEEAADALRKGLLINPNHSSSNYLLGRICMEEGMKTKAFYALCYFLLMEPNTDRAVQSYNTVVNMLVNRDETIGFHDNGAFTTADMVISLAFTLDEANFRMSEKEKIQAKLYYVFTNLDEQKNSGKIGRSKGDELWWDFYSPFFNRIAKSKYFGTFCRYIGLTTDPDADAWIENGRDEIEGFFDWLNEY